MSKHIISILKGCWINLLGGGLTPWLTKRGEYPILYEYKNDYEFNNNSNIKLETKIEYSDKYEIRH